ncbi:hypothetical protein [Haladaptatus sp. NG-SE-30]
MISLTGSVVGFVVNLLIGALGIYIGARVVTGTDDYGYALITAIVGSIIGVIVAFIFGWLFGWIVVLVAWIWVINWRYPGGWGNAIGIGLIAWLSVVGITYVLVTLEILTSKMLGIPGI